MTYKATVATFFKIFYFIAKANGLLPITITFGPLTAKNSLLDIFYSIAYLLFVVAALTYAQMSVIEFIGVLNNPKRTIIFVFLLQVCCSGLRLAAVYCSQIFNYKNLSRFVNRSAQINEMFARSTKGEAFLDAKLSKWCLSKFVATIIQIVCIMVPTYGLVSIIHSAENFPLLLINFLFILYSHMVLILSTGVYFAGMMVIGQFYRNLNSDIIGLRKKCSRSTKMGMQEFCNISDDFDRLTALYGDITKHAANFNKCQRGFIIFSLIQYFVILWAEVFPWTIHVVSLRIEI